MKKYIYLIIFILLSTTVYAISFNDLLSFERDDKNNICDKGEFPILDKDCKLDFSDILNKVWFWKILLIIGIIYIIKKKDTLNKNIIVIVLISLLVFSVITKEPTEIDEPINETEINETDEPKESASHQPLTKVRGLLLDDATRKE